MYSIGLNFEYSRMRVPSLSSGCEIAQFFVRYMVRIATWAQNTATSHVAAPPPLDAQASCSPNDDLGWAPHHSMLFHKMF
jgi:hypothetical protein